MTSISGQDIASIQRPVHTLWSLIFMDLLARRVGGWVVNNTTVSPMALTIASFVVSLGSSGCFLIGEFVWVVAGVLLYQLSNVLDALDGMVARARPGSGSPFALAADHTLDPWRLVLNITAVAWTAGQREGTDTALVLAALFLALHFSDWIQPRFTALVRARYTSAGAPELTATDRALLKFKNVLEKRRLRLILFSVHEREVVALVLGPLLALEVLMFSVAIGLTGLFLLLRFRLDISMLRNEFKTGRAEYLGDADQVWERGLHNGKPENE
jgi:phosphatidylglycerophosphate synthase